MNDGTSIDAVEAAESLSLCSGGPSSTTETVRDLATRVARLEAVLAGGRCTYEDALRSVGG
jgi:hypothetical protein